MQLVTVKAMFPAEIESQDIIIPDMGITESVEFVGRLEDLDVPNEPGEFYLEFKGTVR